MLEGCCWAEKSSVSVVSSTYLWIKQSTFKSSIAVNVYITFHYYAWPMDWQLVEGFNRANCLMSCSVYWLCVFVCVWTHTVVWRNPAATPCSHHASVSSYLKQERCGNCSLFHFALFLNCRCMYSVFHKNNPLIVIIFFQKCGQFLFLKISSMYVRKCTFCY